MQERIQAIQNILSEEGSISNVLVLDNPIKDVITHHVFILGEIARVISNANQAPDSSKEIMRSNFQNEIGIRNKISHQANPNVPIELDNIQPGTLQVILGTNNARLIANMVIIKQELASIDDILNKPLEPYHGYFVKSKRVYYQQPDENYAFLDEHRRPVSYYDPTSNQIFTWTQFSNGSWYYNADNQTYFFPDNHTSYWYDQSNNFFQFDSISRLYTNNQIGATYDHKTQNYNKNYLPNDIDGLKSLVSSLQGQIEQLQREKKVYAELTKKLSKSIKEIEEKERELAQLTQQNEVLDSNLNDANKKIKNFMEKNKSLTKDKNELVALLKIANNDKERLSHENNNLKEQLTQLNDQNQSLTHCNTELTSQLATAKAENRQLSQSKTTFQRDTPLSLLGKKRSEHPATSSSDEEEQSSSVTSSRIFSKGAHRHYLWVPFSGGAGF